MSPSGPLTGARLAQGGCEEPSGERSEALSTFRSTFADDYGLKITGGPLEGLCSRAVVVLDEENRVLHAEQVKEIADEPDYQAALGALSR